MPHDEARRNLTLIASSTGEALETGPLFPLPFSPIERFFRADDRRRYPMAFTIQTEFSGVIDRPAFESALRGAVNRHPLLGSLLRVDRGGQPCWSPAEGYFPKVDWGDQDKPLVPTSWEAHASNEHFDLRREAGFRAWVRQSPQRAVLTTQFHHACTDGIGAYRFLGDWYALYGRGMTTDGPRPELEELDPRLLVDRARKVTGLAYCGFSMKLFQRMFQQSVSIFGQPIASINTPGGRLPQKTDYPTICSFTFSRAEYETLRKNAAERNATTNDLTLAVLLQVVVAWNQRYVRRFNGRLMRIVMPVDMRGGGDDYAMPAANVVGYTFISRRPNECLDTEKLIRGIRDETIRIKLENRGALWNDLVAGCANYCPWTMPLTLFGDRCLSTAVLSNVGDPTRRFTAKFPRVDGKVVVGNLMLERITGVPPLRPKTRATFSVFSYLRQLTVSVRCDPFYFRLADTRELLDLTVDRLRAFM